VTRNTNVTYNSDLDVVVRGFDGTDFDPVVEITERDDVVDDDTNPDSIRFKGTLYVVWQGAGSITAETDILLKSVKDDKPGDLVEISRGGDASADENPQLAVHNEELWVVWNTADSEISEGADDDIVARYFDGEEWSDFYEITPSDSTQAGHHKISAEDRFPAIASNKDGLYIAWEMDDPTREISDDIDLVYRRTPPFGSEEEILLYLLIVVVALILVLLLFFYATRRTTRTSRKAKKFRTQMKKRERDEHVRRGRKRGGRKHRRRRRHEEE
jgi:hypothetical protein